MRLISWNVNGIRAALKNDFLAAVYEMDPDMLCLQESKAQDEQVTEALSELNGYNIYTNSAVKKGYSGTAVLSKTSPKKVHYDIGIDEHDQEGRVIAADYEKFYLITVYTPNSGSKLKRLGYRQRWNIDFLAYVKKLEAEKPVIVCGDLNVAHKDIDLARPKPNYNKNAGYMQEEIDGMDNIVAANLVDTFRYINPDKIKYSWWSYRTGARTKNVGWRIDYFLSSAGLTDHIKDADILNEVMGSDHCPVLLDVDLHVS